LIWADPATAGLSLSVLHFDPSLAATAGLWYPWQTWACWWHPFEPQDLRCAACSAHFSLLWFA
jgi:hypothetical protein